MKRFHLVVSNPQGVHTARGPGISSSWKQDHWEKPGTKIKLCRRDRMGVRDKSSIQRPRFHNLLHWEGSWSSCLVLAKMAFYSGYIIAPWRPPCYSQAFPFSFVNSIHMSWTQVITWLLTNPPWKICLSQNKIWKAGSLATCQLSAETGVVGPWHLGQWRAI